MAKTGDIPIIHPRENPTLIGHQAAQANFLAEFARGQVHHAYLITGPKGIGKATLAYRFARYLLTHGAVAPKAEEESFSLFGDALPTAPAPVTTATLELSANDPVFRRIATGSHADLLTLAPAYDTKKGIEKTSISVDDARKVPEFLSLTPAEGDWRVVMVDAVDQLNVNAANALLKILEEPPARAMLFLICHQPGSILPTIRSRCRQLKLEAPSVADFATILNQLSPEIESHEYAALYALSYGSPGHAITLHAAGGLKWYEGWLNAMHPGAGVEARQKFADSAAAQKSPDVWAAIMHGWHVAMQRISLHPHGHFAPIFRGEAEKIAAIAASTTPLMRRVWAEKGQGLIGQTETFNLDKRYTLRLLADPAQLDTLAA